MITNSIMNVGAATPLLQGVEQKPQSSVIENNPFRSLLEEAIGNVKGADEDVKMEAYKLVTGQTDDLHNITIASTQLTLATDLLIQIRNKATDAYNEIMRMGI